MSATRVAGTRVGERTLVLVTSLLATAVTLSWGFRAKYVCGGAPFDAAGRSESFPHSPPRSVIPCYSDVMRLWIGRGVNDHVFPYIHGGIDASGHLFGGSVEYPVLSGLLMWLGAIGAHTDVAFFVHTALILAPFAIATTVLLGLMTRWWVLLWAATPPLVLYAFHNWELPVVFTSVAAIAVMAYGASPHPATGRRRLPLRTSAVVAAVLLGIGFSLKLYPGLFVVPLAAYVLTGGEIRRKALDWASAAWVVVAAAVTVIATQAPFMIAGFDGWKAALSFQGRREADVTTNSVWYWGLRFVIDDGDTYHSVVGVASPLMIVAGFAVALALGWRVYRSTSVFPWIGVAAAMLAAFMVFHKVHSPQYTLWILPFFVLLWVRGIVVAAYLAADIVLDVSIFRLLGYSHSSNGVPWSSNAGVAISVWVHAIVLIGLIVAFVRAPVREPLAAYLRSDIAPRGPLTRLAEADATTARTWLGTPTLTRGEVRLRPPHPSDAAAIASLVDDADRPLYAWTGAIPASPDAGAAWISSALSTPSRVPFIVEYRGRVVGTTSFYDVQPQHRALSIGYTFYSRAAMGTVVNPTAKLLLLEYAFDDCDAVRVEWHTHEDNARSRAAIAKLGAEFEGLLRKHRRFGAGWRTTAQFAMTDDDWPTHRARLAVRADA